MTQSRSGKYRTELKWALIFAVMYLAWMLMERLAGFHSTRLAQQPFVGVLVLVPSITVYALALLDKRRNWYGGRMSYRQSFVSGCVLTVLIVALSPINQALTHWVISPHYFSNAIEYTTAHGILSREQAMQQFSFGNYIVTSIVAGLITGVVFSAVISALTRSKVAVTGGGAEVV